MNINDLESMIDKGDHLYDHRYFAIRKKELITDKNGCEGIYKSFIYKDSLRFSILFHDSPCMEAIDQIASDVMRDVNECGKGTNFLWYSQIDGFSNALFERLKNYSNPYHFLLFRLKLESIVTDVNMMGLTCRKCTADMIDRCIDLLEDVFTPFPDPPGSFRNDRERIAADFLHESGGAWLFYKKMTWWGFAGIKTATSRKPPSAERIRGWVMVKLLCALC